MIDFYFMLLLGFSSMSSKIKLIIGVKWKEEVSKEKKESEVKLIHNIVATWLVNN